MKMVLKMPFLTFSNVDIQFTQKELTWRSYTIAEAPLTSKRVEFMDKKKFAKVVLDDKFETFMVHVTAQEALLIWMTIHPLQEAQISALF